MKSVQDEILRGLDHSESSLHRREFEGVVFDTCALSQTRFINCRFSDCRFVDCEMSGARFPGTTLNNVRFERCRMTGLNLMDADPTFLDLDMSECVLDYASFAGLHLDKTRFIDCRMRDVDLSNTALNGAVFAGSDLRDANFNHSSLLRADLRQALNVSFDAKLVKLGRTLIDLSTLVEVGARLGLDAGMS
ncbi:MAG: fluoroquinolone resistance protein [Kiritimatiellia bacterium]|jgi:fluoroquinolone resistance protein